MESVKRYKAMVNLPDGVLVADVYLSEDFDRVTAEREALQLLLNNRDDLDDQLTSLEQRRYAEQQAREAAERRVEELANQLSMANRLNSTREDLLNKCMHAFNHVVGFSSQATRTAWYENFLKPVTGAVMVHLSESAALNPTAEAVSHDQ